MAHLRSDEEVATLKRYRDNWPSVLMVYSGIHSFIHPPTKTCQSVDPQNLYKEAADEGEISNNMTEVQNPYKLPLNPELLTVFTKKPDESVNSVVGYHYSFEDNNR
jgi:adenylylsulfate kinase-like enzyme